jgi:hypothetical protein
MASRPAPCSAGILVGALHHVALLPGLAAT